MPLFAMPDGESQGCIHHYYQIQLVPLSYPNPGSVLGHTNAPLQ